MYTVQLEPPSNEYTTICISCYYYVCMIEYEQAEHPLLSFAMCPYAVVGWAFDGAGVVVDDGAVTTRTTHNQMSERKNKQKTSTQN